MKFEPKLNVFKRQNSERPYLNVAVVHEDPLQVEEAGVLEHLLAKSPYVVATHPENLED